MFPILDWLSAAIVYQKYFPSEYSSFCCCVVFKGVRTEMHRILLYELYEMLFLLQPPPVAVQSLYIIFLTCVCLIAVVVGSSQVLM